MKKSFQIFGLAALICFGIFGCSQNEGTRIEAKKQGPSPSPGPDGDGKPSEKPRPAETNISTLLTFSLAALIEAEGIILRLAELDFPDQKANCPSSNFNPDAPTFNPNGNLIVTLEWSGCRTFGAIGFENIVIQLDPELPPAEAIRLKRIKSAQIDTGYDSLKLTASVAGKVKHFPLRQRLNIYFVEQNGSEKRFSMTFNQHISLTKDEPSARTENEWTISINGEALVSAGQLNFYAERIKTDRYLTQFIRGQTSFSTEGLTLRSVPKEPIRYSDCGIPIEGEMKVFYDSDRFSTLDGDLALTAEGAKVSFSKNVTKLNGCSENSPNFVYNLSPALVNQL